MKKITTLILLTIAFVSFGQERKIDVSSFTKLSIGIASKTYIKQGNTHSVVIKCDDDDFDKIKIEEKGDKLVISQKNRSGWGNWGMSNSDVTIYVTMKDIEGLSMSGSGDIIGKETLQTEDIELAISGSGDIELSLASTDITCRISGSGSINLEGKGNNAKARISGSGKVKAEDLEVDTFNAAISGSGSCYITATEAIKASISGSGNVYYKGEPDKLESNSSGSGKIRRL